MPSYEVFVKEGYTISFKEYLDISMSLLKRFHAAFYDVANVSVEDFGKRINMTFGKIDGQVRIVGSNMDKEMLNLVRGGREFTTQELAAKWSSLNSIPPEFTALGDRKYLVKDPRASVLMEAGIRDVKPDHPIIDVEVIPNDVAAVVPVLRDREMEQGG